MEKRLDSGLTNKEDNNLMTVKKHKLKQLTYNTKYDTRANKLVALVLFFLELLSAVLSSDITFFVFSLLISIPLFCAKQNWITKRIVHRTKSSIKSK